MYKKEVNGCCLNGICWNQCMYLESRSIKTKSHSVKQLADIKTADRKCVLAIVIYIIHSFSCSQKRQNGR